MRSKLLSAKLRIYVPLTSPTLSSQKNRKWLIHYLPYHSFPFILPQLYILLGSKITADGNYSHEIKRHLLLGRKAMTNLDSILKRRDITLPTKIYLVKAMVFPVLIYGCERKVSAKELMLLNCGVGEDSWKSLGLQGDPTSPP